MTPNGASIQNPAFDVTPAKYITAIITEHGVLRAPYNESIQQMASKANPQLVSA
jgi:methylthioribose-1-phosphate isomerase